MELTIFLMSTLGVLFYILKLDAPWVRIRIEMTLAMIGIDYKPSKATSVIVAAVGLFIVYGVIFER